jgi:Methyltransferase domain
MEEQEESKARAQRYWERRKNSVYLHAAQAVCRRFGEGPATVIDVGSNGTPTLEWHRESAKRLVSVDLVRPYRAEGVESVVTDFLAYEPDTKFDLVTCFQVLEHVPEPGPFARKLLTLGKVVVISVPYKWPKGKCKEHPNDPVDEAKLRDWFGRRPNFSHLSKEIEFDRKARLIHVYYPGRPPKKKRAPNPPAGKHGRSKKKSPLHLRLLRRVKKLFLSR